MFTEEWLKQRKLFYDGSSLPYNAALKARAKLLRQNMTKPERKLWYEFLQSLEFRFFRQRPIDHYIVDFYCATKKLVIEIDGESHFTDKGLQYDDERTKVLSIYGLTVLRFSNDDVISRFGGVCEVILREV